MEGNSNPIHQHYVPVFILKNFAKNGGRFFYYDLIQQKYKLQPAKNTFAEDDTYTFEKYEDNYLIEKNLSKYETEIAPIIKRIVNEEKVELNREELEALRIFLSLLSFRSRLRKKQYLDSQFDSETRMVLENFKKDNDYISLWKKELKTLSSFRTLAEIKSSSELDPTIKEEFATDYEHFYMTIVKGYKQKFIISDVFPTLESVQDLSGNQIILHMIYPLSPEVAIILNSCIFKKEYFGKLNAVQKYLIGISKMKGNYITEPKVNYSKNQFDRTKDDVFSYCKNKVYEKDMMYINFLILNEARNGFIFTDRNLLLDVLSKYKFETGKKNDYNVLESVLVSLSKENC